VRRVIMSPTRVSGAVRGPPFAGDVIPSWTLVGGAVRGLAYVGRAIGRGHG
jgi:hypothetical protein